MTTLDGPMTDITIGELVAEQPALARVFERLGIDYCCGGKRSLGEACAAHGLDAASVARGLAACDGRGGTDDHGNWLLTSTSQLIDHIIAVHHGYLRAELPRLAGLIAKVTQAHGEREPHLAELQRVFAAFRAELDDHMLKEERILFPMIRQLETARGPVTLHCGTVENPIRVMVSEHDNAGAALARMRELTHGFAVPPEGCNTYRVMLEGLHELEADMHRHVHEENNILFPKAVQAEAALAPRG